MQMNTHSPYTIDVPGHENLPDAYRGSTRTRQGRRRMRTSDFCFVVAGLAALTGMTLGMRMGISQDFTLAPAHAHLNLLGWVTMTLYGLYHRSAGRTGGVLGWSQVVAGAAGAVLMAGGLALYLSSGDDRFMPLVVVGSLIAFLGMILFVAIILIDALGLRLATPTKGAAAT
jgi:hypothetical protein